MNMLSKFIIIENNKDYQCNTFEDVVKYFIDENNNYIIWYNTKRIKQSLGYMSPIEYRHSLGLSA